MFKKIVINIIFFLAGLAVMFCFIKACDTFLWFRPYLHFPLPSGHVKSLHLIAEGGPFRIYSSQQTGQQDDFVVARGNKLLMLSEVISKSSNIYEISHLENGDVILHSVYHGGCLEKRDYSWDESPGHAKYIYFDNNADGFWDRLADIKNGKSYEWQNDRWYQIVSDNPITLGTNTFCMPTNTTDGK